MISGPYLRHTESRSESGSILIVALGAILSVGAVAAGTTALLQQNSVTSNEETRAMQGRSVADAYRLFIEENSDSTALQDAIGSNLYTQSAAFTANATSTALTNGETQYVGFILTEGGQRWGKEFPKKTASSGIDEEFQSSNDVAELDEPCGGDSECSFDTDGQEIYEVTEPVRFETLATFMLNSNSETVFTEPVYFSAGAILNVKNKGSITFESLLLIDGSLTINDEGGQTKTVTGNEAVVRGSLDLTSEFELNSGPFAECSDVSAGLTGSSGNTVTFTELAVGGNIVNGEGGSSARYTDDLDCIAEVDINGESRDLDLSGGDSWNFSN